MPDASPNAPDAERLRFALEATLEGIWDWDLVTGNVWWSDRCFTILGYDPQAFPVSFETWRDLVHPEDQDSAVAEVSAKLETGAPFAIEFRMRCRDGSWLWILGRGKAVAWDAAGRPTRMVGTHSDISARKTAEQQHRDLDHLLRFIIHHDPNAVAVFDTDLRFIFVSQRFCDDYGCDQSIIGRHHYEVFPEIPERWRAVHRRALAGEVQSCLRDQFTRADGSISHTRWECRPWYHQDGSLGGMVMYTEVITEQIRMEQALRDSEARLRAVFDHVDGIPIQGYDTQRRVIFWNKASERLYGYSRAEALGRAAEDLLIPAEQREAFLAQFHTARHSGSAPPASEWTLRTKDDRRVTVYTNNVVITNHAGETEIFSLDIDLSERRQLEERIQQMEKMEVIGQLAGGVAHDFNNQLACIMGYAELLGKRLDDPRHKGFLDHILTAAQRSADLTTQLLTFSRKGTFNPTAVDVRSLIQEVISMLRHSIDKRIHLVDESSAGPLMVHGDASQIQNALLNLALNARDAMPDGGRLSFSASQCLLEDSDCRALPFALDPGPHVAISVTDSGCGMSDEIQAHIFEPFFTTKEVGRGTGMGLAAVFGTVVQHHGAIRVSSSPGHGSTFTLLLPEATDLPRTAAVEEDEQPHLEGLHILIIDDEAALRTLTSDLLSGLGCRVHTVADGLAGIEYVMDHHEDLDLVILDMIMPRLNGPDTFQALQAINPDLRILLASGYTHHDDAQRLLQQGAVGFLAKPYGLKDLIRALHHAVGTWR